MQFVLCAPFYIFNFFSFVYYIKFCTAATRALYYHYKGLVVIVQRFCSDSTEPLYDMLTNTIVGIFAENSWNQWIQKSE